MRWIVYIFLVLMVMACQPQKYVGLLQSHEIALANPIVRIDSILFKEQASIRISPVYPKTAIRYTTDGSVVKPNSPLCPTPLLLNESTDIKYKAYHPTLKASEELNLTVKRAGRIQLEILSTSTQAKSPYEGKGLANLSNLEKGSINFKANQEWLGFQNELIQFDLLFEEAINCEQITLSTLSDHNSWIFNPSKIELVANDQIIASQKIEKPIANQAAEYQFLALPIATSIKEATLKIYMDAIPDWHAGKGTTPWFFIDEIIVE